MSEALTFEEYAEVPWNKKWMNVVIIWLLIMPVGLILMWSNDIYRNKKDDNGQLIKMENGRKAIFTVVTVILMAKALGLMP